MTNNIINRAHGRLDCESDDFPPTYTSTAGTSQGRRILAVLVAIFIALVATSGPVHANPASLVGGNGAMQNFNVNVEGYDPTNAYLGAFLVTLMYPDNLARLKYPYAPVDGNVNATRNDKRSKDRQRAAQATLWHHEFPKFLKQYEEATKHLFASGQKVEYIGVNTCIQGDGVIHKKGEIYDYEAALISTSSAVFVVIRGTDRVHCADSEFNYKWSEWLSTDFVFWQEPPLVRDRRGREVVLGGPGALVHRGFWQSTMVANQNVPAAQIVEKIRKAAHSQAGTKKIWIMGHSLGSAHAQTLAMLLTSNNLRPQGVYAYSSPHVGNPALVRWMNQNIGKNRIQRFDFKIDPVTILPTYTLVDPTRLRRQEWGRAGVRNYYSDVQSVDIAWRERTGAEDINPFFSAPQALARGGENAMFTTLKLDATHPPMLGIVPFCYHHPHWLLHATFNQVPRQTRRRMPNPAPLGIPLANRDWGPCNAMTVDWGMRRNVVDDALAAAGTAGTAAAQAIEAVSFNVGQLFANLTSAAVQEGVYYIESHKNPGRYLGERSNCAGQNGCELVLSSSRTAFWIKSHLGSYHIERQVGTKWKRIDLAAQQLTTQGGKIQIWDRALGPNQAWMFFRSKPNGPFLIRNSGGVVNKVIDARSCTATSTNCAVKSFEGISNSQDQLWVLRRAN